MPDPLDEILGAHPSPARAKARLPIPHPTRETCLEFCARRQPRDARRLASAAETINPLPAAGEALHMLRSGAWDTAFIIPAILSLAAPRARTHAVAHIATLSYSVRVAQLLLDLLDARHLRSICFVSSCYFESHPRERARCAAFARELEKRGSQHCAVRNHCKIIVLQLADGSAYVAEGSGNLRSSSTLEQLTLTASPELARFHAAWMEEIQADTHRSPKGRAR